MQWKPWCKETFVREELERVPVWWGIGTHWCEWTADMLRETYRDGSVVELIQNRFLPIWVDAEQRTDTCWP